MKCQKKKEKKMSVIVSQHQIWHLHIFSFVQPTLKNPRYSIYNDRRLGKPTNIHSEGDRIRECSHLFLKKSFKTINLLSKQLEIYFIDWLIDWLAYRCSSKVVFTSNKWKNAAQYHFKQFVPLGHIKITVIWINVCPTSDYQTHFSLPPDL